MTPDEFFRLLAYRERQRVKTLTAWALSMVAINGGMVALRYHAGILPPWVVLPFVAASSVSWVFWAWALGLYTPLGKIKLPKSGA